MTTAIMAMINPRSMSNTTPNPNPNPDGENSDDRYEINNDGTIKAMIIRDQ